MSPFAWLEQTSLAVWIGQSTSFFAYPAILLLHTIGLTLVAGVNCVVALRRVTAERWRWRPFVSGLLAIVGGRAMAYVGEAV